MEKTKRKIRLLKVSSLFILIAPVLAVAGFNFKDYYSAETGFIFKQSVEVGTGTILALSCGVLLALGKTNIFKGSKGIGIALVLSILLNAVLADLILILSAVFVGSVGRSIFQTPIANLQEAYKYEKQAGIQAKAFDNIVASTEKLNVKSEARPDQRGVGRV